MRIETTLNIDTKIKSIIVYAALQSKVSCSHIIILCMKKTMRNIHRLLRYNHSIEYQKSNPSERWNHFHIVLSEKEYEYFIDMRKLCKRSVSFLVALSVNKYIEEVIAELTNIKTEKTDNYQFLSYILIGERIDNVISWRIYWDLPRKGMRLAKK